MSNLEQDYATSRVPLSRNPLARRSWNGQWTLDPEDVDNERHRILVMFESVKRERDEEDFLAEKRLAELCGLDLRTESWKASMRYLHDHGYTVWVRKQWSSKDAIYRDLSDDDRRVKLCVSGKKFGRQSLEMLRKG